MQPGENPHADLVRFLEEQNDPDFLKPPYQIFEPCVIIGDRSKLRIKANVRIDSFVKIEIGKGVTINPGVHIASFAHLGIGGGDYIEFSYCGDCGQIQGDFPLAPTKMEES